VSTVAGNGKGFADGSLKSAQFNSPSGIYFDEIEQCLFVYDRTNDRLRRISLLQGKWILLPQNFFLSLSLLHFHVNLVFKDEVTTICQIINLEFTVIYFGFSIRATHNFKSH
jgi:hypothetical protein